MVCCKWALTFKFRAKKTELKTHGSCPYTRGRSHVPSNLMKRKSVRQMPGTVKESREAYA